VYDNLPSFLHRPSLSPPNVLRSMYRVLFPGCRSRKLTSHFHVVPKLKIRNDISPLSIRLHRVLPNQAQKKKTLHATIHHIRLATKIIPTKEVLKRITSSKYTEDQTTHLNTLTFALMAFHNIFLSAKHITCVHRSLQLQL
jgi:ubiquinone/menaquinone biosynthesis C-methylase UbiE